MGGQRPRVAGALPPGRLPAGAPPPAAHEAAHLVAGRHGEQGERSAVAGATPPVGRGGRPPLPPRPVPAAVRAAAPAPGHGAAGDVLEAGPARGPAVHAGRGAGAAPGRPCSRFALVVVHFFDFGAAAAAHA